MLRLTITVNREPEEEQTGARALSNFVNAIRSPATRKVYEQSLRRYMNHLKIASVDSLLESTQPKLIESQLIDYVMYLRNDGIAYATIQSLIAPLFTFYQLNDVVLNRKKVQLLISKVQQQQVDWRRDRVLELSSQSDIPTVLHVDRSIISRDMAHLRHRARENLQKHIHQTIPKNIRRPAIL